MKAFQFVAVSGISLFSVLAVNGQTPAPKKAAPAAAKPAAAPKPAAPAKPASPAKPAAAAATPAAPGVLAQANDPVVIQIGATKVTKSEYERFLDGLPEQIKAQASGPNKRRVAEQFAELKMMALEARKRKVDQDPKLKAQLEFQMDQMLASTLYKNISDKVTIDEAEVVKAYDEMKSEAAEVKAKHILIRFQGSRVPLKEGQKDLTKEESLAKAKELKAKIEGGGDFAAIAKAESDDAGSGAAGGDLGFFSKGQMVPAFEQAAFSQPIGKVGDPVESPFGYHLILVEEKKAKSLEDLRKDIEAKLRPELAKKEVDAIKTTTPIVVDEAYFGK
jgi:peptidyl-prolyl cis-trans isomerase C